MEKINRGFEGPFLLLGMLPGWPEELERRSGYKGPHARLSHLLPIPVPLPNGEKRPARWKSADMRVSKEIPIIREGNWARRVEVYARAVQDDDLLPLLAALDKPRTRKQIAAKVGVSNPRVDVLLRALQMQIGRKLRVGHGFGRRGRPARTFWVEPRQQGPSGPSA